MSMTKDRRDPADRAAAKASEPKPGFLSHVAADRAGWLARVAMALAAMLVMVIPSMGVAAPVTADPAQFEQQCPQPDPNCWGSNESRYAAFYTPPDPLPAAKPGDLIRSEPSPLVLEPSGQLGAYVADGTRIMYRSTDNSGNPVAVTGTYFEPHNPWPGQGPRPLIAFATGPYGLGDQCAPSRMFNQGIHFSSGLDLHLGYEETFIATMVARGFAVVVTDGVGLGTPGPVPILMRQAAGTALLDAARAAMKLPGTSLDPHGPVALWGWSSGGQASGSAAELAPSYAPELHLVGAWIGAPPADLTLLPPFLDGSIFLVALGYALNGIAAAYPQAAPLLLPALSDQGKDLLTRSSTMCVVEGVLTFSFHHLNEYFNVDPAEVFSSEAVRTVLNAQRLGTLKPAIPVFISTNRFDPFFPWGGSRQLALDWCAKGADVEFWTNRQPPFLNKLAINHLLPYFVDGERAMGWIADRFNGLPTTPTCADIPTD